VKTYIYNVFYRDGTARTEQYTGTWRGFCAVCSLTLRRSDVASLERVLNEDSALDAEAQHTRLMERTHHA
jgi:hypothetical protein